MSQENSNFSMKASMEDQPTLSAEEKTFANLLYASALICVFAPLVGILLPLVLWILKKDYSAYVDRVGKEVLNFVISFTIYGAIAGALVMILVGVILLPLVSITFIVLGILGLWHSTKSRFYRYPMIFRLIAE